MGSLLSADPAAALLEADDSERAAIWSDMQRPERDALPADVRALCIASTRKARPWVMESVRRAEQAQAKVRAYIAEQREPLTDLGNAARLVTRHGENIRYVPEFKRWIEWDGLRWLFDEDGAVMRLAKDTARSIYAEAAEAKDTDQAKRVAAWAATSQSLPRLSAMIELAKSEPDVPIASCELDRDPLLLGVANGTVALHNGTLLEPRREDLITKSAHAEYLEDATCPTWEKFLDRIFACSDELIDFMQRALGYSLTGDTTEQVLFFDHGLGANGKSTLLDAARAVMGDYAMQSSADMLMAKRESSASNDVARLRGARLVATVETEDGRRMPLTRPN